MAILNFTIAKKFFLQVRGIKGITSIYEGTGYKPFNVKVGDEISVDRYLSDKDLDDFVRISGDDNPVHINTPRIFHGAFLHSIVSAVIGTKLPGPGSLLVEQKMRFPNACYVNQTVTINVKVIKQRKLVICAFTVFSHKDKVNVMEGEATLYKKFREC